MEGDGHVSQEFRVIRVYTRRWRIRVTKEIKATGDLVSGRGLAILCATAAANYPRLVDRPIQLREFRV